MSSFSRRPRSSLASGARSRTLRFPTRTRARRWSDWRREPATGPRVSERRRTRAAGRNSGRCGEWASTRASCLAAHGVRRRTPRPLSPPRAEESAGMSALVTPGNLRSALAVTRSLGRQGVAVTVADERRRSLAGVSRYCRDAIRCRPRRRSPRPSCTPSTSDVERGKHRVLIPTDDIALSLIIGGAVAIRGAHRAAVSRGRDRAARPRQGRADVAGRGEGHPGAPDRGRARAGPTSSGRSGTSAFPPSSRRASRAWPWTGNGEARPGTHYVHTRAELEAACRAVGEIIPFPLVQEYIPGDGRGVFVLMNRGRLRAAFAHRRLREKPPSGGVSVLSESVALDPEAAGATPSGFSRR